jgi:predicted metal-binding transcription factor (methanogenesis marker protein 9)
MAENKIFISYTNLFQNSINSINVSASEYLLLKERLSYWVWLNNVFVSHNLKNLMAAVINTNDFECLLKAAVM